MSIEKFVDTARAQLAALHKARENASGSKKGGLTRKIHDIEDAVKKATRRGIQE